MALMQIFLSYAGSDKAYAKSLASQLQKRGFSVWSPRDEVLPGDNVWLQTGDRKSTRLNSSHRTISYAVFCLKKKKKQKTHLYTQKKKINNKTKIHTKQTK